ncbi:hypothetical protein BC832DRAFT_594163 [Gaertneriomyces semiglobifer]|nr:hypothetical protein BC832DRAFT_594163 [Gaertneriomyces semiglobifer]
MVDNKSPAAVEAGNDGFVHKKAGWSKKKKIIVSIVVTIALLLVIVLPIIFFVVVPKVAQSSINGSQLEFLEASILEPTDTTFKTALKIKVTNAGHTSATLENDGPTTVYWVYANKEVPLLEMQMGPFSVADNEGMIDQTVENVKILDPETFAKFNKILVVSPEITWRLKANMKVRALSRTYKGLTMDKEVTLKGMDRLQGVYVKEFEPTAPVDQTGASPTTLSMKAIIRNPSPIGIDLASIAFDIALPLPAELVPAGSGIPNPLPFGVSSSTAAATLAGNNQNTEVPLTATIAPIADAPAALRPTLGTQMTGLLAGQASVKLVAQIKDVGGPAWLKQSLVGLPLNIFMGRDASYEAALKAFSGEH